MARSNKPRLPETADIYLRIREVLTLLNPWRDCNWDADGKPALNAIIGKLGEYVTREEVEDCRPGFNRDLAKKLCPRITTRIEGNLITIEHSQTYELDDRDRLPPHMIERMKRKSAKLLADRKAAKENKKNYYTRNRRARLEYQAAYRARKRLSA
jgi:hypothetical protein